MRHTFATLLISMNIDVQTISHKLGYVNATTTMNLYIHNLKSTDKAGAELLEDMLIKDIN